METEKIVFNQIKKLTKVKFNLDSEINDLKIDSLDLVILISDIEKELNITISDEELMQLKKVADIVNLLELKLKK
ncbi:acyl carrier protein [[Mycoplasma] falconis]|uniref:Acyl carrier protein n=1 Tax=[Mycoplasma] falconis TaxID=92403 RepID=A0A501XA36_9BACT|nr:phosphopantetheine-binding protein [[Mycoplasma] falconis]TPE57361.1 acyl carrier protein [[Mycoplasma] falconis]